MQKETVGQPPFGVIGGEDCLYLNVYTNSIGRKRPVMFFVHGGMFIEGNGNILYGEDYFVSLDAVMVFVNFRLGPLGKYHFYKSFYFQFEQLVIYSKQDF